MEEEEKKGSPDFTILLVVIVLVIIGLIMCFSSSSIEAAETRGSPYFYLIRQTIWAILGAMGLLFFRRFNYRHLKTLSPILVLISFLLLTAVFIPGLGVEVHEAKRWLGFGTFSIQPSEFTKLALIIFTAAYLSSKSVDMKNFWSSSFIPLGVMFLSFLFIMGQPDLGTALIIGMGVAIVVVAAGIPLKQLAALMGVSSLIIPYLYYRQSYWLDRLTSFVDPWADSMGSGWQVIQSIYALGSGGLFGVGLGRSMQKLYYLPEPHNDFIFAVIGEELGFIGTTAIFFLFCVLIWRGMKVALHAPDKFGSLLAGGLICIIAIQALVNIGVVTGSLPVTGLNLPFISAGGSSLFFNLCAIGIVLNISKHVE